MGCSQIKTNILGVYLQNHHISKNCSKVFEVCNCSKFLSFYLDLPFDAIGTVCHQFGFLSTYLQFIPCADFLDTTRTRAYISFTSARPSMS